MHSCTTSSGALAPAVIRTVSAPSNHLPRISATPSIRCAWGPQRPGNLGQPPAVRAVLAAQHQHHVGPGGQLADRFLAVLGRVADVVLGRIGDSGELLPERGDHDVGVIDTQGRLSEIGDFSGVGDLEPLDVLGGLDQDHPVGGLAHGADDLVVPLVADQDDGVAFAGVLDRFEVDLGDERAGGVDGEEAARGPVRGSGARRRGRCRAGGALGNFLERLDEDRPGRRNRSTTYLLWTIS